MTTHKLSRQSFIRWAGLAGGAALLSACAPQVVTQVVRETQLVVQTQLVEVTATPTPEPARNRPIDVLVATYLAAWSEPDGAKRLPLLEKVMEADGTCALAEDTEVFDRASHNEQITAGHIANPGSTFRVTGQTYAFEGHLSFAWILSVGGNELPGTAYGELTPDGKLTKIVIFF